MRHDENETDHKELGYEVVFVNFINVEVLIKKAARTYKVSRD